MSCMSGPNAEEKPSNHRMVSSGEYCYSDMASSSRNQNNIPTHLMSQLRQSFDPNQEIYDVENMIGFPSKNLHHNPQHNDQNGNVLLWKELFGKPTGNHHRQDGGGASSSKEISDPTSSHHHEFYQQQQNYHLTGISDHAIHESLMDHSSSSSAWNNHQRRSSFAMDDQSLRCVFPCEGNERPSQGLSLSLSSSNPSTIGLQSFELRSQHEDMRFGPSSSRSVNIQPSQVVMNQLGHDQFDHVRGSKYLGPARELLNEFCNLESKQSDDGSSKRVMKNSNEWEDENSIKKQSLYSLDLLELQRRKTKLLQMLEEVDKRYRHYCDQMKAVKSSFEAVAGDGAATVYSCLASKAMSRHFRCLRDGIMSQIKATKKAMGDKDIAAPGTVKGETPRLRLLDQTLRQQRALQQMSMMEIHPWRPQRGLPERSVSVLRAWLFEHFLHPYPSDVDKHILARQTGLSRSQVSNWFINARVRLWKPMVEEMYLEELKENEAAMGGPSNLNDDTDNNNNNNKNDLQNLNPDQKPTHDQLVRIDSECLSSIINNPDKNNNVGKNKVVRDEHHNPSSFGRVGDSSYGAMELDFSSYTTHHSTGGNGVSLTLGLHQHGDNGGVSLAFSPASQGSLFYSRDHHHMEGDHDVQTVQYSLLDSENQNLPYRNLMGAQLLHDLAG